MSTDQLLNVFLANPSRNGKVDRRLHRKLDRFLAPLITASYYPKSQLILSSGQSADYLYFVEEGLARGFCFEPGKKKEITIYFWKEQSTIMIPESFFFREPSPVFIEVTPGTSLLQLSHHHLMDFISSNPEAEIISRNLVLQHREYEEMRYLHHSFRTAWERYRQLLKEFPMIEQQVSKGVIASYLNITPQSLSRMLRNHPHP